MSDLISREEAIESIRRHGSLPEFAEFLLKRIPAVDAVPVVKCFDCQYRNKVECPAYRKLIDTGEILPPPYVHFCSYGERKGGEPDASRR